MYCRFSTQRDRTDCSAVLQGQYIERQNRLYYVLYCRFSTQRDRTDCTTVLKGQYIERLDRLYYVLYCRVSTQRDRTDCTAVLQGQYIERSDRLYYVLYCRVSTQRDRTDCTGWGPPAAGSSSSISNLLSPWARALTPGETQVATFSRTFSVKKGVIQQPTSLPG